MFKLICFIAAYSALIGALMLGMHVANFRQLLPLDVSLDEPLAGHSYVQWLENREVVFDGTSIKDAVDYLDDVHIFIRTKYTEKNIDNIREINKIFALME